MTVQNILPSFPVTMKNMIVGWFISYRITTSAVQRQKAVSAYRGTFKVSRYCLLAGAQLYQILRKFCFPTLEHNC